MTSNRMTTIAGGVLAAFFALSLVCFTVRSTEVACVSTFGKPGRPLKTAGLKLKAPWPIQRVHKFDGRIQSFNGKFEQTYTRDGKNLVVMVYAGWRIEDPIKFLKVVGNIDEAQRFLDGLIRTYKNGIFGQHPFSHLVSLDPEELQFEEIEQEMLEAVQREAAQRFGIQVEFLGIKMLNLPEAVTKEVFNRMQKEREGIAETYRAKGRAEAGKIRATATRDSKKITAEAEAQARQLRGEADAKAAQYYKTLKQDPEFAIFLQKLDTMETVMKDRTTVVLDPKTPPFDLTLSPGGSAQ